MDKINFVNNSAPALSAENLNELQGNVENAIDTVQTNVNAKLDKAGGTMKGTLNTGSLVPTANNTYDLGSSEKQFGQVFTNGIRFDNSAVVAIKWELNSNSAWCLRFYVNGTMVREL